MCSRQPAPDGQPSSPDADHRYTPAAHSQSWHPRNRSKPSHQPSATAASAGSAGAVMSGSDKGDVRHSSGTYLQPVRQKAGTAAAGTADGSWPPTPPPPPPSTDGSQMALTLPPRGGTLPVPPSPRVMNGDIAQSVDLPLHDYEEVPANGHPIYARPQEHSPCTDMTETAILLPQKLPQDQNLNERSPAGRKCTNPLYVTSEKLNFDGTPVDANRVPRRKTCTCCTQACTVGMLATLLSTAALILAMLPLFGISLMSRGEGQSYQAFVTNGVDEKISQMEHLLKDLQAKVNKQEALLNETTTKAPAGTSPLSRCRFHQLTATSGNTDWIPESQNGTVIGAYCYMRNADESVIQVQAFAGGPSHKRQYRCNCTSRASLYYCTIAYWLCPDA